MEAWSRTLLGEREIAKAAPLSNCLFASQATGIIFILNQDI